MVPKTSQGHFFGSTSENCKNFPAVSAQNRAGLISSNISFGEGLLLGEKQRIFEKNDLSQFGQASGKTMSIEVAFTLTPPKDPNII